MSRNCLVRIKIKTKKKQSWIINLINDTCDYTENWSQLKKDCGVATKPTKSRNMQLFAEKILQFETLKKVPAGTRNPDHRVQRQPFYLHPAENKEHAIGTCCRKNFEQLSFKTLKFCNRNYLKCSKRNQPFFPTL